MGRAQRSCCVQWRPKGSSKGLLTIIISLLTLEDEGVRDGSVESTVLSDVDASGFFARHRFPNRGICISQRASSFYSESTQNHLCPPSTHHSALTGQPHPHSNHITNTFAHQLKPRYSEGCSRFARVQCWILTVALAHGFTLWDKLTFYPVDTPPGARGVNATAIKG